MEKSDASFEVIVRLSDHEIKQKESEYFEVKEIQHMNYNYYNIMNINRLDAYDNICKDTILKLGLDPLYCLCDETRFDPSLYNNL